MERRIAVLVQKRTQVYQPSRAHYPRGQKIGSHGVHREHMREAVFCLNPAWLAITDGGIVNDGIECAQRVDLFRHAARLGHAG